MRTALAIFRKDVRHLWPRIALVLTAELLIGWGSFSPPAGLDGVRYPLGLVEVLAWWYLVASAIHEEAIPGNRQYWLTRPFCRRNLLAAKLLFILAFTCFPLFLGQVASLLLRGISPLTYLPDILVSQLFFLATTVLPAAAWASVTAGMVEFVGLSLAALIGYAFIISLAVSHAQNDFYWGGLEWPRGTVIATLTLGSAAAVLLLQYFRRRVWLCRGILAAAVLTSALLRWSPGWHTAFALQGWLSAQHVAATVARIVFDPTRDPRTQPPFAFTQPGQDVASISLPVRVTGIPDGMALYSNRVNVTVHTPNGERWSSGWNPLDDLFGILGTRASMQEERLLTGDGKYWLHLSIDRSFYRRTNSKPTHLHAKLALTLFSPQQIAPLAIQERPQPVLQDGFCRVASRERVFYTTCKWPARTPAISRLLVGPGRAISDWVGSYGPYPTSGELWQSSEQAVRDPPPAVALATRGAVAHFERDLDIPDLREWTNR